MPLPLPNLDDKSFTTLVDEAIKIIPRLAPEWTNHNRSDPGITLIELLAWLTEMQQYHLNWIGPANELKYLKLLGMRPRAATCATGQVTFALPAGATQSLVIPSGTKLAAHEIVFETRELLHVLPITLKKVISSGQTGLQDNSETNSTDGLYFDAFGGAAVLGSLLYLGFDQAFPAGQATSLTFNLFEDYSVARGVHGDEVPDITPSAIVHWEYYRQDPQGNAWATLAVTADETQMLSQSGRLTFRAPVDLTTRQLQPIPGTFYWLRARLVDGAYELPPRIDAILLNTVPVVQTDTQSEVMNFSSSGLPGQNFTASRYLALVGLTLVQVREPDGTWRDWQQVTDLTRSGPNDRHYTLTTDFAAATVEISFGDGDRGRTPAAGQDNIRLIAYEKNFANLRLLGASTGLPNQTFALDPLPVRPETLLVQIGQPVPRATTASVEVDVSCLAHFERRAPDQAAANQPITVTVTLHVYQALARLIIVETLHGDLTLVDSQKREVYSWQTIRRGQVLTHSYQVIMGPRGGSIDGVITVYAHANCPALAEPVPVSVIEITTPQRASSRAFSDWIRVDDFDASRPADRHFILDSEAGLVHFGDGVNGDVPWPPPDEQKNIRLLAYQSGGGEIGNVIAGTITKLVRPLESWKSLTVRNRWPLAGGQAVELHADAMTRARAGLRIPSRAVTDADFAYLARATPGLRVARAQAIPLFAPDLVGYPQQQADAVVTVVVVPFSTTVRPTPSAGFLQTVCRHLDQHRLITTQVHVMGPAYVGIGVQARVRLKPGAVRDATLARVTQALDHFLSPLEGGPDGTGWPFGRTVYRSEIYQQIEDVDGVDCTDRVVLVATGVGSGRDPNDNVTIPPHSLVYPTGHQIEIGGPDMVCRGKGAMR